MRLLHVVLLGLCAAAVSPAQALGATDVRKLRCESDNERLRECPVANVRAVRLLKQLSHAPCEEGRSWGRRGDAIWVSRGCRAEFGVLSGDDERPARARRDRSLLACNSQDGRWKHCNADVRGGVELVRQLSRNACIRGQSWGTDARGIWVNGGCRAEFRVAVAPAAEVPSASRFRCESDGRRERSCPLRTPGSVRLVKQLSSAACVPGRSWGIEGDSVWVREGCRAEFEVGPAWTDGRW
ncbi:MAG TPA: DUF3011 domain-containing protein [Lysobacter sp.]|nr:DUF3011 domain-containing protein [Lysobacter sp.]